MTSSSTLPFSWYTDEEQLRRERATIFARAWQYAGPERGHHPTRLVPHHRCRRHSRPRHPRRRRRAARVHQRLPASRRRARGGLRGEELDPVPLPRVDLRPRRSPACGSAIGPRARLRPERLVAAAGERRHLGAVPVRQSGPAGSAARRTARRAAGDPRPRHRRRQPRVPLAGRIRRGRELEGRRRELPRVLPLRDRASCVQRPGRRASRPVRARSAPDLRRPVLQIAGHCRARPVPPALPEHRHQRVPRPGQPVDRPDPPQRAEPNRALPRLFLRPGRGRGAGGRSSSPSTTRSGAKTARWSSRCSAACPPACSTTGGSCSRRSLCWPRFRPGCANRSPRGARAGSRRRARDPRRAPRARGARPVLRSPSARRR